MNVSITMVFMIILYSANLSNAPGPEDPTSPDCSGDMTADLFLALATVGAIQLVGHFIIAPIASRLSRFLPKKGLGKSAVISQKQAKGYLVKQGFSESKADDFVSSFPGNIRARIVEPGDDFMRYTDWPNSRGRFLTTKKFSSPEKAVEALHLQPYNNNALYMQGVKSTGRSIVFEGGIKNGSRGAKQIFIISDKAFQFSEGEIFWAW